MKHLFISGVIMVCLLGLTTGCAPNRQYRTNIEAYTGTAAQASLDPKNHAIIEQTTNYSLGFVEFDEEGRFWDTNQVKTVENMIRTEANLSQTNNLAGIILVVFVHGWKNNALHSCSNVGTFRTVLEQMNAAEQAESKTNGRPARKMVGVYCGWRGLSWTIPYIQDLTFWNRKATAHKVGGYGAMTQLFVELEKLEEQSNGSIRTNGPPTDLIFVGHSFGGAAVYSAISEFVTEQFVKNLENPNKDKPLKPLGDQVILLNPAFEASRHFNLNRLATTLEKYPEAQRPVLSVFQSEGDSATHYALPIGQFFATMFERFSSPNERHATRDAVGWFEPYVTHRLEYNTNAVLGGTAPHSTYNRKTGKHEYHGQEGLWKSIQNVEVQRTNWVPNGPRQIYEFDDSILKPKKTFRTGDPFLVVAVDTHIMKDHDDIGNPVLINFLREYVQFCRAGTTK